MEKSINYYRDAFKNLTEDMCRTFNVQKARVKIGYDEYKGYPNGMASECDIAFDE